MKKPTLWLIISSFISYAGFSDPYVWQDYDDFSGSSLDTSKWEIGYWDGAQAPNIENGKAHLYGTGVGVGSIVPPSFDELVGMPQNGTNQSFLFLKDDLISGVEAEISLDSTFSGIYLGIMEAVEGGSAYAGIELNSWKQSGPSLEFSNTVYENGTETLESTLGDKSANLGQSYRVSVVKGESAYQLFLNSELIGEYPVRGELLYFVFGGYHDEDLPWDGYIDNVRVITVWEDYEDFSGSNINTDRWSMGHWDGGNLPVIGNQRLTLSGNTVSGFNEVLPTNGMLEFNPDIQPLLEEGFSSSNGTESHSFLELANNDISAIAVEVTLPFDAHSNTAIGLYASDWTKAFSDNLSDKSFFGLDLWSDHIDVEYVDPNTGSLVSSSISTQAGSSHVFSFIFDTSMVSMHVDGEKVAEFSSSNFSRDSILIRAMNEAGESFTAYAQNVWVIRNWEDYDDFSSGTLDASKWDISYYGGGKPPAVENGVVKLYGTSKANFNEFKIGSDFLANYPNAESDLSASGPHSNVGIANANLEGIEFEVMIPSSVPSETGVGLFVLNTQELGNAVDSAARANATKAHLGLWYSSGNPQIGLGISGESTVYIPSKFNVYYRLGILFGNSTTSFFVDGEKKAEFTGTFSEDYLLLRGTNENDVSFDTYLDNVRVLRRSTTTTQPDPVTVVSDPTGQAVVVQVGNEYQWNSTLDGVTLWLVGSDSGSIIQGTIKYEAGNYSGNFEFLNEVTNPIATLKYAVNENGYLAHTESLGQQYYQILTAENGKIGTIGFMNDLSQANHSSEPTQLFFTTRAAAEEYYYSKVNPKDWMWFDNYPWVYSNELQEWLYFYPSGSKLLYYSNKNQAWREFSQ
tara:strand:+ start:171 stop:2741 length:2571 start_codon:yes stop_codon:yes gene_type:complete